MFKKKEKNYALNGKECNSKIKYYRFNKKQLTVIEEALNRRLNLFLSCLK